MNLIWLFLICLVASGAPTASCGDPTNSQAALLKTVTTLSAVPYHEAGPTNRTCGKGFILTARRIETEWFFVLYPNFNRGARIDERTFSKGLAQTKKMIETVARGQQVYWLPRSSTDGPSVDVLRALEKHCKTAGLLPDFPKMTQKTRQQTPVLETAALRCRFMLGLSPAVSSRSTPRSPEG